MALTDNIVAYYKLEDGTDDVGSADLSINGGANYSSAGVIGNGVTLDGSGDFLTGGDVHDMENTQAWSVSFWVQYNAFVTLQGLVTKGCSLAANSPGWGICSGAGGNNKHIRVFIQNSATNRIISDTADDIVGAGPQHIVVTYDGSSAESGVIVYVNDAVKATAATQDNLSSSTLNTDDFRIGRIGPTGAGEHNGYIDEVGIWNRELSSTEVTELYNGGAGLQYPFSTTSIKTINGLAVASVKTVKGLAIASVKSVKGLE